MTVYHIMVLALIRSHFTVILVIFNVLLDSYNKSKEGSWEELLCLQDLGTMTNYPNKITWWSCYTSSRMYQVISRGIVTTVACTPCSLSFTSQSWSGISSASLLVDVWHMHGVCVLCSNVFRDWGKHKPINRNVIFQLSNTSWIS